MSDNKIRYTWLNTLALPDLNDLLKYLNNKTPELDQYLKSATKNNSILTLTPNKGDTIDYCPFKLIEISAENIEYDNLNFPKFTKESIDDILNNVSNNILFIIKYRENENSNTYQYFYLTSANVQGSQKGNKSITLIKTTINNGAYLAKYYIDDYNNVKYNIVKVRKYVIKEYLSKATQETDGPNYNLIIKAKLNESDIDTDQVNLKIYTPITQNNNYYTINQFNSTPSGTTYKYSDLFYIEGSNFMLATSLMRPKGDNICDGSGTALSNLVSKWDWTIGQINLAYANSTIYWIITLPIKLKELFVAWTDSTTPIYAVYSDSKKETLVSLEVNEPSSELTYDKLQIRTDVCVETYSNSDLKYKPSAGIERRILNELDIKSYSAIEDSSISTSTITLTNLPITIASAQASNSYNTEATRYFYYTLTKLDNDYYKLVLNTNYTFSSLTTPGNGINSITFATAKTNFITLLNNQFKTHYSTSKTITTLSAKYVAVARNPSNASSSIQYGNLRTADDGSVIDIFTIQVNTTPGLLKIAGTLEMLFKIG